MELQGALVIFISTATVIWSCFCDFDHNVFSFGILRVLFGELHMLPKYQIFNSTPKRKYMFFALRMCWIVFCLGIY